MIKQGSHSDPVATLVIENERLKTELDSLRQFVASINSAMSLLQSQTSNSQVTTPALRADNSSAVPAGPAVGSSPSSPSPFPQQSSEHEAALEANPASISQELLEPSVLLGAGQRSNSPLDSGFWDEFLKQTPLTESSKEQPAPLTVARAETIQEHAAQASNSPFPNDNSLLSLLAGSPNFSNLSWGRFAHLDLDVFPEASTSISNVSEARGSHGPLVQCNDTFHALDDGTSELPCLQTAQIPPLPAYRRIPCMLLPALREEKFMHGMFNLAHSGVINGGTLLGEPKLIDCLMDSAANQFSHELKQYLEPMRQLKRKEEYLASYWLISTLIHWYIHTDEASYQRIPSWLRPTEVQLRISHPLPINFMPWPSLRDRLVVDYHIYQKPVSPVMTDLGKYLEVDLGGSSVEILLLGEAQLLHRLRDIQNWKLKPGFFDLHPQFRESYQRYHTGTLS